ncbi:hypothetical protein [Cerasicoccus maritimus]|uniref:hypothetical protein n=1 Tax=Cerasicoccus maritimus TaxID=490089 RepID=UPI002852C080|nr:hypothetical protein [Cerasicoccus maritimus]
MGFTKDPALSALVNYRHQRSGRQFSGIIAYLNNHDHAHISQLNPHHRDLFEGAQATAKQLGYKLEEFWLKSPELEYNLDRISNILSARGIEGLIVGPQQSPHTTLDLKWELFSSVQLFFSLESPRLHTISTDVYAAVQRVFAELCQLGYRRIGFISDPHTDERVNNLYTAAYFSSQHKLPYRKSCLKPLIEVDFSDKTLATWLKKENPDAVIALTPTVINRLQDPEFIGKESIGIASPYQHSDFTEIGHIVIDKQSVGAQAMRLLASLIEQNDKGVPVHPITHLIFPSWTPGNSVHKVGPPVSLAHQSLR